MLIVDAVAVHLWVFGVFLYSSEAVEVHTWRIKITEFPVFPLISFVANACEYVFMSKTTDPCIVMEGFGVLVPIPERPVRCITDLGYS